MVFVYAQNSFSFANQLVIRGELISWHGGGRWFESSYVYQKFY